MSADAENIAAAIAADSDQINADDLIGGPLVGTVTRVQTTRKRQKGDQPVVVHLDTWRWPWKPCKTMVRLLVAIWGGDPRAWVGQSVTLYRDPEVKFSGEMVGGIRVSHITGIDQKTTISLTETRGRKRAYTVHPMQSQAPTLDAVLESHGYTVAILNEARAAKDKPPVSELTDAQRRQLAVRYQDRGRLEHDLQPQQQEG